MFDNARFDNPRVRGLYTSLSDGWVYMNAATDPQLPERVSGAVSRAFRSAPLAAPIEETHGEHSRAASPGTRIGESHIKSARVAIADLVGARPEHVILGSSRKQLINQLAESMSYRLRLGRQVVLSRVDDGANIDPWLRAADLYGADVRWAEADLSTGVLPAWQYTELVSPETAVVAVAAANEHVGTVTDVAAIGRTVHAKSDGIFVVDANAIAPFHLIDIADLGVDVLALDVATIGGPSIGALVFRSVELMGELFPHPPRQSRARSVARFGAHKDVNPGSGGLALRGAVHPSVERAREWLELGGLSEGLLGGVSAAVDHLADLASDAEGDSLRGTRRRRLRGALPLAEDYVHALARMVVDGLHGLPGAHVIGLEGEYEEHFDYDSVERIPRLSFFIDGVPAEAVHDRLFAQGVVTSVIPPGDSELLAQMGVFESSTGAVCVGLSVHNTVGDVNRLLRAVASLR